MRDYGPVEVDEWIGLSGCRMSRLLDERVYMYGVAKIIRHTRR